MDYDDTLSGVFDATTIYSANNEKRRGAIGGLSQIMGGPNGPGSHTIDG